MPVNAYLGRGTCLALVDTGTIAVGGMVRLALALRDLGLRLSDVEAVLYTHPHVDHMGGGAGLRSHLRARHHLPVGFSGEFRRFMLDTQTAVRRAYAWAKVNVDERLARDIDRYCEAHLLVGGDVAGDAVTPGTRVTAGPGELAVVSTPGHTAWCTTYLDEERGLAFTGDLVIGGATSFNPFLGSDLEAYLTSLDRLAACRPRVLMPGHGKPREDPDKALTRCRATMETAIASVMQRLTAAAATELELLATLVGTVTLSPSRFPIDIGRLGIVLEWLRVRGACSYDTSRHAWVAGDSSSGQQLASSANRSSDPP